MSDEERIIQHPVLLGMAVALSVSLFVVGLAVVSFLMRDAPLAPRRASTTTQARVEPPRRGVDDQGAEKQRPPVGGAERQSASTAITPVFPDCYREARARDPSLAREVELLVGLDTRPGSGTITSVRVGRGGSPFLAACLRQALVGAGFPAGADGVGEVKWSARLDGERAVLVADKD